MPVDKVVLMADLYNCPELKNSYCKNECPIGREMPIATAACGLEGTALRIIRELDGSRMEEMRKQIIEISAEGVDSSDKEKILSGLLEDLDRIGLAISEFRLAGMKILKGTVNYD